MAAPDYASLLSQADYPGALAAWRSAFGGREESPLATWELAAIEEQWGDSLFFADDPGSLPHYQAAQRALMPAGSQFASPAENDRRMEAYGRLTQKLYAIAGDGKPRPSHDAQPHPDFTPVTSPPETPPEPTQPSKSERLQSVLLARQTRTLQQTGLGRLDDGGDHWRQHHVGNLWFEAARALAPRYPDAANSACEWSLHYFGLYNRAWTAHLPASRWDSDGGQEMMEVQDLQGSLATGPSETAPPDWAVHLLAGDWEAAQASFGTDTPAPDLQPLAAILADACRSRA